MVVLATQWVAKTCKTTDGFPPLSGNETRKPKITDVSTCEYTDQRHGGLPTIWVVKTWKTTDGFPPLSGNELRKP